ncbi:helix-turn-helix domain-containing protein [Lapillicoccus sp.]|uniref:helix-turn-helix domain-containing protein n=1 Tax=Lapillicoccus sp. TaxID=1909287 RepID=UPI003267C780
MARELDITRANASYHLRLLLDAGMAKSSMLRDLGEGWTEFVSRTWLWVVVVVFGLLNAVWSGVIGVLGPLIATRVAVMAYRSSCSRLPRHAGYAVLALATLASRSVRNLERPTVHEPEDERA